MKHRSPYLPLIALATLLTGCGGGGGGEAGGDGGGGGNEPGPLSTRADAVRAASVVLGLYEAFDPNANDLLPFADPVFPAKRLTDAAKSLVASKALVTTDCDDSGKRADDDRSSTREFGLFDRVAVDTDITATSFFACKTDFIAITDVSGFVTVDGAVEFGEGLDEESDFYTYYLLGKSGDASMNYRAQFEQQDDNEQVVETDLYNATGLIENASFIDRIESRLSQLSVSYTQTIGGATNLLQATLGTSAAPFKLARRNDGGQTLEGSLQFSSSNAGCVGGSMSISTPTPLKGDSTITEGELVLSSGSTTASFAFTTSGDVDVSLGNQPAERISAADFQAVLSNSGC